MLSNIFSWLSEHIERVFLGPEERVFSLAREVYDAAVSCATIAEKIIHDLPKNCGRSMTATFTFGFLGVVDRVAFQKIPARRAALMDELVPKCCARLVEACHGSEISPTEREALLEESLSKYNEVSEIYTRCKKMMAGENEPAQNTFFWEFGKQFAASTGNAFDPLRIELGVSVFLDGLKHSRIVQRIALL